jgi:two-component system, OmpR family, response regulator
VGAGEPVRVLVVEDDAEMAAVVRANLENEGYAVQVCADGPSALIEASRRRPDLAVLDVSLPGMSGFELCRRLRLQDTALPVLMLTARDSVDDRVRGLDAGADDYLVKPFAFSELAARLRALLRRDAQRQPGRLEVGTLVVDSHDRSVSVEGVALQVSPKEFSVLRLLCQNAGETVSRVDILAEVWGTTLHADANLVDQYVSYLRRKLATVPSDVSILTERGVGFRLTAGA